MLGVSWSYHPLMILVLLVNDHDGNAYNNYCYMPSSSSSSINYPYDRTALPSLFKATVQHVCFYLKRMCPPTQQHAAILLLMTSQVPQVGHSSYQQATHERRNKCCTPIFMHHTWDTIMAAGLVLLLLLIFVFPFFLLTRLFLWFIVVDYLWCICFFCLDSTIVGRQQQKRTVVLCLQATRRKTRDPSFAYSSTYLCRNLFSEPITIKINTTVLYYTHLY